jgi:nucleotide-binding universal stress UspA family protein
MARSRGEPDARREGAADGEPGTLVCSALTDRRLRRLGDRDPGAHQGRRGCGRRVNRRGHHRHASPVLGWGSQQSLLEPADDPAQTLDYARALFGRHREIRVDTLTRTGDPAAMLAEVAREPRAGLVVVGRRWRARYWAQWQNASLVGRRSPFDQHAEPDWLECRWHCHCHSRPTGDSEARNEVCSPFTVRQARGKLS